jgi:hypothetical protein
VDVQDIGFRDEVERIIGIGERCLLDTTGNADLLDGFDFFWRRLEFQKTFTNVLFVIGGCQFEDMGLIHNIVVCKNKSKRVGTVEVKWNGTVATNSECCSPFCGTVAPNAMRPTDRRACQGSI